MIRCVLMVSVLHVVFHVSSETNKTVSSGTDNTDSPVPGYTDGIRTTNENPERNGSHNERDKGDVSKRVTNIGTVTPSESRNAKNVSIARIQTGKSAKKKDVWKNYDQVGAKNFIVVTVVVYSLVGTLSLLLMRMCRRAQRIHNETDRSDELVDQYLRASMDLKDQGYKDRMMREKKKTCMTLTSIEEEQLKGEGRRVRYHHVLSDVDADEVFLQDEHGARLLSLTSDDQNSEDSVDEMSQQC